MTRPVDSILETAESELKYWGGDSIGPLHLAVALCKRSRDTFEAVFGPTAIDVVKNQLRASPSRPGDSADYEAVRAAGRDHANPNEALRAMAELLRKQLDWVFVVDAVDPEATEESAPPLKGAVSGPKSDDLGPLTPLSHDGSQLAERAAQVDELIVMLARLDPMVPLLVGRKGSGRTTLLGNLAARLADPKNSGPLAGAAVLDLKPEIRVATNLGFLLDQAVNKFSSPTIVCIEDLEVLLNISGMGLNGQLVSGLRQMIEIPNVHFVFSVEESLLGQMTTFVPGFTARLSRLDVGLDSDEVVAEVVGLTADGLGKAHGVSVPPAVVDVAASIRPSPQGQAQPGLGISMIDSACVRAVMRTSSAVEVDDLRVGDGAPRKIDFAGLCKSLKRSVVGQDHVVERVASRLALTQAGLDLRPERPDGVFLFVGPTGVGKTEMARAINREVFGDSDRMIRLDMSEYVHDWSVSRLIGPQPGYVGSTEPASWLTTRVAKNPSCVLLLDEIEKAHPVVWNTFLQVFDAGRLTDSRGEVADFSRVVVVMTSNLGAEAYSKRAIGFGNQRSSLQQAEAEVAETIRRSLSPELINRLDDTLSFSPLDLDAILEIARTIVDDQLQRVTRLGYQLSVSDEVVQHLAESGYEPAFGARHLQRNVDRQLLVPLALAGDGSAFRAEMADGVIEWIAE